MDQSSSNVVTAILSFATEVAISGLVLWFAWNNSIVDMIHVAKMSYIDACLLMSLVIVIKN